MNKGRTIFSILCLIFLLESGCSEKSSGTEVQHKTSKVEEYKLPVMLQKYAEQENKTMVEPYTQKSDNIAVKLETSMGDIIIELYQKAAPVTVENFLTYTQQGFYDGTIFHRVISNFMIQGGGYTTDMQQKQTRQPIVNEANNGLENNRGTIAMARRSNPNSATSQFFINHKNKPLLNYSSPDKPGYAVFGKVIEGMDVVDKIASVETTVKSRINNVPVEPVTIDTASILNQN
jgi:cyclophilin family peptidyl-prolyl cis-trans isomerase